MTQTKHVIDVTAADFEDAVVRRSAEVPVLVVRIPRQLPEA